MPPFESSAGGGGGPNGISAAFGRLGDASGADGLSAALAGEEDLGDITASLLTISQITYQKNLKQENAKFA
jgi:hypothetical protein